MIAAPSAPPTAGTGARPSPAATPEANGSAAAAFAALVAERPEEGPPAHGAVASPDTPEDPELSERDPEAIDGALQGVVALAPVRDGPGAVTAAATGDLSTSKAGSPIDPDDVTGTPRPPVAIGSGHVSAQEVSMLPGVDGGDGAGPAAWGPGWPAPVAATTGIPGATGMTPSRDMALMPPGSVQPTAMAPPAGPAKAWMDLGAVAPGNGPLDEMPPDPDAPSTSTLPQTATPRTADGGQTAFGAGTGGGAGGGAIETSQPDLQVVGGEMDTGRAGAGFEWTSALRGGDPMASAIRPTVPLDALQAQIRAEIAGHRADPETIRHGGPRHTEIDLAPAELGRIRITLETAERGLVVSVAVDRPEAMDAVRRHLDGLQRALHAEGVTLDRIDLGGGQRRDTGDRPGNAPTGMGATAGDAGSDPVAETSSVDRISATGRLDIRL